MALAILMAVGCDEDSRPEFQSQEFAQFEDDSSVSIVENS